MAPKTIDHDIPEELLVNIFKNLSDSPRNIKDCRFVCRKFNRTCTQFLLPRVVFSIRIEDLTKLSEILLSPNINVRHGVKELIYDASTYNNQYVATFETLKNICQQSERTLLESGTPCHSGRLHALLNRGMPHILEVPVQMDYFPRHEPSKVHLSFLYHDYLVRLQDQQGLKDHSLDMRLLRGIFSRLCKIRKFTFTDFRSLAAPGEDYSTLCDRLFGHVMEPDVLTYDCFPFVDGLRTLFDVFANIPKACIQHFSIGSHQYDVTANHYRGGHDRRRTVNTHMDRISKPRWLEAIALPLDCAAYRHGFNKLQSLRLLAAVATELRPGIRFSSRDRMKRSLGRKWLASSANTLVDLSLPALDLLLKDGFAVRVPWVDGITCIDHLLLNLTFPSLHRLQLEGWPLFDEVLFQNFLARHDKSLRVLRIEDCAVPWKPSGLARWLGRRLHLSGVVIKLFPILLGNAVLEDGFQMWDHAELEKLCLDGRPNSLASQG